MKSITALLLLIATHVMAAEAPQVVEIEGRYSGFDAALFGSFHPKQNGGKASEPLITPRVTMNFGQPSVIEMIREVKVPGVPKPVSAGVTIDLTPTLENGQITLTGKSTVRQLLIPGGTQPLSAVSFTTRETFFRGTVQSGKPLRIRVGDGPNDRAQITLTATTPQSLAKAQ